MEMEEAVAAIADLMGLAIPEACHPGVASNLAVLARHMAVVQDAARDAPPDPAELLRP